MKEKWTLSGHFSRVLGVGEASRRLHTLMQAALVESVLDQPDFDISKSQAAYSIEKSPNFSPFNLISCVNPDQLGALLSQKRFHPKKLNHHIGFWSWELSKLPEEYERARQLVDEVWTVSTFCSNSFRPSDLPVKAVCLPVPIPIEQKGNTLSLEELGLNPNLAVATVSFDFFSDVERKNPAAAIEAFKLAFGDQDNIQLLIKTINGNHFARETQVLKNLAGDRKRILFYDGYLSKEQNSALLSRTDIFLSLHRSEGYGINLADAMARKIPVVATGYSGNLDFMDDTCSVLVPYKLTEVSRYAGLSVSDFWAEPDIRWAAGKLRELYEDPGLRRRIGMSGFTKILKDHSLKPAVAHFERNFLDANR